MSANSQGSFHPSRSSALACVVFETSWNIVAGVRIHADRQRLSQALSIPEYIEAWLEIPGAAHCPVEFTRRGAEYEICCRRVDGATCHICGIYRAIRSSRVVFTWREDASSACQDSLVRVGLQGDFAYTRLTLSHMGLASEREYKWHRDLWHRSLARLGHLFS